MLAQLSQNGSRFIDLYGYLAGTLLEGGQAHYGSCDERCIIPMGSIEVSTIEDPHCIIAIVRK